MPLAAGMRVGQYEIIALLGAGGMGEVYRARDSKLGRDVALKVLSEALARDADYLARFQREAQVLASLNHPNIAAIYGLEEGAIVMELVEGASPRGPMPLADALPVAKQIAEALEAAHEKGIVHRDLKPANIKITPAGVVKVLDFGLAKAADPVSPSINANSPTLTMRSTQAGIILGTAGYMAPEQAAGKPVDKRADIWSFGVVLWELLTGASMFEGETISHTLAHVLTLEIDLDKLPPPVRPLAARCLDRNVKTRLRDIGEARIAIDRIMAGGSEPAATPAAVKTKRRAWLPWTAGLAGAAVALGGAWMLRPKPQPEVTEFEIAPPRGVRFLRPALSPDGRKLAFISPDSKGRKMYLRNLDQAKVQPIADAEVLGGGYGDPPFWSPDSRRIGFFSNGRIRTVDIETGAIQTLCNVSHGIFGASWSSSGNILYASGDGKLFKVPEAGGEPVPVLSSDAGGMPSHPIFFPDGKHFIYFNAALRPQPGGYLASVTGSQPYLVVPGNLRRVCYVPGRLSKTGYLMYFREGQVFARPFDLSRPQASDKETRVISSVSSELDWSASNNGILAYCGGAGGRARFTWISRDGSPLGTVGEPAEYQAIRLAPDGFHAAYTLSSQENIWLMDLERAVGSKLTYGSSAALAPVWSPDGSQIAYASGQRAIGGSRIYRRAANGSGSEELLLESKEELLPMGWSPNGAWLLYIAGVRGRWNHYLLPLSGARTPVPFVVDNYDNYDGRFSPDGRWIAYSSTGSGTRQVYVRPVPEVAGGPAGVQGKWQISSQGGSHPSWRQDSKELYYLGPERRLMAASVDSGVKTFRASIPRPLFAINNSSSRGPNYPYDVSGDGTKFLVLDNPESPGLITIVLNWELTLRKQ